MNERTHARTHRGLRPGNSDPLTRLHVSRQPALSISMVPPAPASQAWPGSSQSVLRWLLGPQLLSTCDRGETGCALAARAAQHRARHTAPPSPLALCPRFLQETGPQTGQRLAQRTRQKERKGRPFESGPVLCAFMDVPRILRGKERGGRRECPRVQWRRPCHVPGKGGERQRQRGPEGWLLPTVRLRQSPAPPAPASGWRRHTASAGGHPSRATEPAATDQQTADSSGVPCLGANQARGDPRERRTRPGTFPTSLW